MSILIIALTLSLLYLVYVVPVESIPPAIEAATLLDVSHPSTVPLRRSTTEGPSIRQGWVSQPDGRGSFNIIWNCVVTIFLCSWTVLCLNLPAPGDTEWGNFRRKCYLASLGIVGPEFILQLSMGQWTSACSSVKEFRRSGYDQWTMSHAFLADMGGFTLHTPDWPPFPLNSKQLHYLVINKYIEYPEVNKKDIADKNKNDGFARVLTVLQTLWFFLDCVGRGAQGLELTTFELTALSFILCTLGTWFFWAHKPSDVGTGLSVHTDVTIAQILLNAGDDARDPYHNTPLDFVSRKNWSWNLYWSFWMNILRKMGISFAPKVRPINRIPNDNFPELSLPMMFVLFLFQSTFAAIHFVGWNLWFPSRPEQWLWRASTCVIMGSVIVTWFVHMCTLGLAGALGKCLARRPPGEKTPQHWIGTRHVHRIANRLRNNSADRDPAFNVSLRTLVPVTFAAAVYCFARAYFLVENVAGLRAQPESTYATVEWFDFVPHL
ncbi:MAG: hypothetical protein M1833_001959 [Piccolia ochrophora]|nr:MAG: hypothetical protein M1833_001959 [Piccolia ochrophora]